MTVPTGAKHSLNPAARKARRRWIGERVILDTRPTVTPKVPEYVSDLLRLLTEVADRLPDDVRGQGGHLIHPITPLGVPWPKDEPVTVKIPAPASVPRKRVLKRGMPNRAQSLAQLEQVEGGRVPPWCATWNADTFTPPTTHPRPRRNSPKKHHH